MKFSFVFIFALFVLFMNTSNVFANDIEVEFNSISCEEGFLSFDEKELTCNDRDGIGILLDMSTIVFRSVSFICTLAPEPTVTKATAIVTNGLSIATAFTSFLVKNMPCRQSGTYPPDLRDEKEFVKAVCASMNKNYNSSNNTCEN